MVSPLTALTLFALVLLTAVKLFHTQIEKAGAPLTIPLVVLIVIAVGLTVYHDQKEVFDGTQGYESAKGAPEVIRGGGGGGRGSWRERFRQTSELVALVRKLPLMDKQEAVRLSSEQAASLAPLLQSLETDEKLTQGQAKAKVKAIKKVLTPPQLEVLDKTELPRRRFSGRRGGQPVVGEGRPSGKGREGPSAAARPAAAPDETQEPSAGRAPAAPAGTAPTRPSAPPGEAPAQPRERGKGRSDGRRRFNPNMNPFQRERAKPALLGLLELLDMRQKGQDPGEKPRCPERQRPTNLLHRTQRNRRRRRPRPGLRGRLPSRDRERSERSSVPVYRDLRQAVQRLREAERKKRSAAVGVETDSVCKATAQGVAQFVSTVDP